MGMLRTALATAILAVTLAACGADPVEPPPTPTSTTPSAPTTTASTTSTPTPTPPVMPEAAKEQSEEGAKAFAIYYTQIVDYTEQSLDTSVIRNLSAPTCSGCTGGIKAIEKIARQHGHISGGGETVTSLKSEAYLAGHSISVSLNIRTAQERVVIPGKSPLVHPAGEHSTRITLLPRPTGWIVGELRTQ